MRSRIAVFAAALLLAGCGGSGRPDVVPAGGTVTYEGEPLANASVTFTPASGPPAVGTTDAQGKFTLRSGTQDGAVPGTHKVSVFAVDAQFTPPDNLPDPETDPEGYHTAVEEAMNENPPSSKLLIPQRYTRPVTSGLSFDITEGGENQFDVKLTK